MQAGMLFLLFWPAVAAIGALLLRRSVRAVRWLSWGAMAVELGMTVILTLPVLVFPRLSMAFGTSWISAVGARFDLGWDALTAVMAVMTALIGLLVLMVSPRWMPKNEAMFCAATLGMMAALMGVFLARDGLLFYVFWELALIPAYGMVLGWGDANRSRVALRFFVMMMAGSLLMLLALLALYFLTPAPHTFHIGAFADLRLPTWIQHWIFWGFLLGFAIKTPLVPFHMWQPATYRSAAVPTTILLAGLLSKMGLYGFYRLVLPVAPQAVVVWAPWVMLFGVLGAVYAAAVALVQADLRRIVAFSSISHLSLVVAGMFSLTMVGLQGSVVQLVSHAVNSVGLFLILGVLAAWAGSEQLSDLGGWAKADRWFTAGFLLVLLGSMAVPLTNGFIGEFLILMGIMNRGLALAALGGVTMVLGAWVMLRLYHDAMLGPARVSAHVGWSIGEKAVLGVVCVLIFAIGLVPGPLLRLSAPVASQILVRTGLR